MKSKKTPLVLLALLVMLLVGAGALYTELGQDFRPHQLAAEEPQETESPQEAEPAQESEPVQEETSAQEAEVPPQEPPPAPDFTVYDAQGGEVRLSEYLGKPIVLNFWASWCGPCQMEMPYFQEKYQALGDQVQFLMVNCTDGGRETLERATSFIQRNGYTFPVFYDTTAEASLTYGAYALPLTVFINAEGYVAAYANMPINGELLQQGIDMIL